MPPRLSSSPSRCPQTGGGDDLPWPALAVPDGSLVRPSARRAEGEGREAQASKALVVHTANGKGVRQVGSPLGDQSWAFGAPRRPQGGPFWLRLSSSALHTHMDTTAAFPSLNCMMNGWPCGEEAQVEMGAPRTLRFITPAEARSQPRSYFFSPISL